MDEASYEQVYKRSQRGVGSQADYYQKMVQSGVLSANEVRKEIGYAPFEGGDEHRIAYSDAAQNTLEDNKSDILEKEEIKE